MSDNSKYQGWGSPRPDFTQTKPGTEGYVEIHRNPVGLDTHVHKTIFGEVTKVEKKW